MKWVYSVFLFLTTWSICLGEEAPTKTSCMIDTEEILNLIEADTLTDCKDGEYNNSYYLTLLHNITKSFFFIIVLIERCKLSTALPTALSINWRNSNF